MERWGTGLQSNRPVVWIKFDVRSRICLFTESGQSLSPYSNSCNKHSFARSTYLSSRNIASILARRSRLYTCLPVADAQALLKNKPPPPPLKTNQSSLKQDKHVLKSLEIDPPPKKK